MVRLKDIAERAGVSIMTVSKALRGAPDIAAGTRARIRDLAQQMGYVPNSMAQSLRTHNTRLIGLILPAVTNPIFARLILAVEERAHALGCDLILSHTLNLAEREATTIRRMISRRVEGLLLFPVHRLGGETAAYNELAATGIPTVILGPAPDFVPPFVSVQTDDEPGAYQITQHLLELGHRRIAFLAGPPAAKWAQERFQGYRQALRDRGISVDDHLVFAAGGTVEEGDKAALQLLQESSGATGIQAVNDLVAIGAANRLLNEGIRIPEALSVTGFGNVLTSAYFRVPLTTARQPKYRMGMAAMDLLEQVKRGQRPESVRLPAELLVRGSSAAAPPTSCLSCPKPPTHSPTQL
jgi:LacI family transcriptional regulator